MWHNYKRTIISLGTALIVSALVAVIVPPVGLGLLLGIGLIGVSVVLAAFPLKPDGMVQIPPWEPAWDELWHEKNHHGGEATYESCWLCSAWQT